MKKLTYISLIILVFLSCQNKDKKKTKPSSSIVEESLNYTFDNYEATELADGFVSQSDIDGMIDSVVQNCECNYYHEMKSLILKEIDEMKFLVCCYSDYEFKPGYPIGELFIDSSAYLSGFTVFECNRDKKIILEGSEYNIDSISVDEKNVIITRLELLPGIKSKGYFLQPIFDIKIGIKNGSVTIDTLISINFSDYNLDSFESFYKNHLLKENENMDSISIWPETRILYKFLRAINNYPKAIDEYKKMDVSGAATREYYFDFLEYLKLFEREITTANPQ